MTRTVNSQPQGYVWGASVDPLLKAAASGDPEAAYFDLIIMSDLVFNHSQVASLPAADDMY